MTAEEERLQEKMMEYEEAYFEDFTLKPDSILRDFICFEVKDDSDKWVEIAEDLPDTGLFYCVPYVIKIADLDGAAGEYDIESRTITIGSEYVDDQKVILHEMIHAYINLFENSKYAIIATLLECLLLRLYTELKTKISNLDGRIIDHAHVIGQEDFRGKGAHGLLFFLKSLDLDIRLDLPLGSVCSYGRDDTGEEI